MTSYVLALWLAAIGPVTVDWDVVSTSYATCPSAAPYTDRYGITHYPQVNNLQICYATHEARHSRSMDGGEAVRFVLGAPTNRGMFWSTPERSTVKLVSVRYTPEYAR